MGVHQFSFLTILIGEIVAIKPRKINSLICYDVLKIFEMITFNVLSIAKKWRKGLKDGQCIRSDRNCE